MWKIDTTQTGNPAILREYEWLTLDHIFEMRKKITSKSTFDYVNEHKKISRATIIGLLYKLNKAGILGYDEVSGKGGFHREHHVLVEREDIPRLITLATLKTLTSIFPEDGFLKEVFWYSETQLKEFEAK